MAPTLEDGQHIVAEKVSYRFHPPRRGDIVVLRLDEGQIEGSLLKRVVALPGETVEVRDDGVFLCQPDGQCAPLDDPNEMTVRIGEPEDPVRIEIPADTFFVMGDNREHSTDSRTFGPVARRDILGKAWLTVWPLNRMSLVARAAPKAER